MMQGNKKGNFGINLFGFFFVLTIVTGILLLFLIGLPTILYEYGIKQGITTGQQLVDMGVSNEQAQNNIIELGESYKLFYGYADYLFIFFMIGVLVQSLIAAVKSQRQGILSFFGYITLGNILLLFLIGYAVEITSWILNEIVYNIVLVNIDTGFINWFFEYNIIIVSIWFVVLLVLNMVDLQNIMNRIPLLNRDSNEGVRFEE